MINIENLLRNYLDGEFKERFPASLKAHEEQVKNSIRPFVKLMTKTESTKLWESKFGGDPYMPVGYKYPTNSKGEALGLLAQINFDEMPPLKDFPEKGILQFFANFSDDCPDMIGLNFDNQTKQDNFRVIYHPEVEKDMEKLVSVFDFLTEEEKECSPVGGEYKVVPEISFGPVGIGTNEFLNIFNTDIEDHFIDADSGEFFYSNGHKLGGYPYFTQADPREYGVDYGDFNILLFQLDTDDSDGVDIMWGDSGVGNFFIKQKDLKELNFSNVLYNWDCC